MDSSSSFLCCSTGTNDFFSPLLCPAFLWLLSVSPRVPEWLISPAGPWGEARPGCRGQITRSGGRSLDCAPRELSRSRSVMASSMSCLLPQARLPHLVSSHRAGPGARNAACHMSAIQPDITRVCPGILDVIIIIIALTLGVLTRFVFTRVSVSRNLTPL